MYKNMKLNGSLISAFIISIILTGCTIKQQVHLKKLLTGKSLDALTNFGFNVAGMSSRPSRITAKIKPTIMIGKTPLTYPGYITIKTEYSGQ